jgi:hypothetical protein
VFGKALLVDIDNRYACRIISARPDSFHQVEAAYAQLGDYVRVNHAKRQGAEDYRECGRAAWTA